ncbi:lysozyme-like domain-containing protein [Gorgonomyces haynaldii]|nr:lysozyme-like domain-containing protein [Gorgonomyces haynaldii]
MSLTPCQKSMAEQITNLFEYSQTTFRFAFCKNINDGRGYTSGIIGFTTGTQDAYSVIAKYTQSPGQTNEFAPYLSTLSDLAKQSVQKGGPVDNVAGLSGYCDAWKKASENPIFRRLQIDAQTVIYYEPALKIGAALGLKNPASFGQLYDGADINLSSDSNGCRGEQRHHLVFGQACSRTGADQQWFRSTVDQRFLGNTQAGAL